MGICESKPASESKGVNEGVPPDDRVDHLVLTMMGVLHCNWFLFKVFSRYAQASCRCIQSNIQNIFARWALHSIGLLSAHRRSVHSDHPIV
jgi:hypothetical protein